MSLDLTPLARLLVDGQPGLRPTDLEVQLDELVTRVRELVQPLDWEASHDTLQALHARTRLFAQTHGYGPVTTALLQQYVATDLVCLLHEEQRAAEGATSRRCRLTPALLQARRVQQKQRTLARWQAVLADEQAQLRAAQQQVRATRAHLKALREVPLFGWEAVGPGEAAPLAAGTKPAVASSDMDTLPS